MTTQRDHLEGLRAGERDLARARHGLLKSHVSFDTPTDFKQSQKDYVDRVGDNFDAVLHPYYPEHQHKGVMLDPITAEMVHG